MAAADMPYSSSALRLSVTIVPSRSALTVASSDASTIAADRSQRFLGRVADHVPAVRGQQAVALFAPCKLGGARRNLLHEILPAACQLLLQIPALGEQPGRRPEDEDGQQVVDQEIAEADSCKAAIGPVRSGDQRAGEGGDDVDVTAPAPQEDEQDGQEEAAPEMRLGHGNVQEKEQDRKQAGKCQDEIRARWMCAHIG